MAAQMQKPTCTAKNTKNQMKPNVLSALAPLYSRLYHSHHESGMPVSAYTTAGASEETAGQRSSFRCCLPALQGLAVRCRQPVQTVRGQRGAMWLRWRPQRKPGLMWVGVLGREAQGCLCCALAAAVESRPSLVRNQLGTFWLTLCPSITLAQKKFHSRHTTRPCTWAAAAALAAASSKPHWQ
jgi:hypothetical protein